ncbi:CPBP family intramembrane glutamic endopeptidase [Candidatus Chloroploca sp. Khr17]|uniref:CPBP family intramembrane glutamic endopeptidase n=1 Tax=Candidatus Chloroploca sp. Khr17 TaxID=2496869 RepID=UPI00101CC995|nr:CPBP family intramembrane glutamic endopeptidase [Candidatus Chloroploca sp. Khr17]
MQNEPTTSRDRRDLIVYFILAYAISWSIGIPLALGKQGLIPAFLPPWTHYLVAFGPLLAALLVTGISRGRVGLRELGSRMIRWRVGPIWWIAALSPLLIGLVVVVILNRMMGAGVTLASLGDVSFLPPLGIVALALWILTFGIGEEAGWRGFALPRLQKEHTALTATSLLAGLWALWHLPQFFYLFDPAIAVGWAIGLYAGAIVFTWLYNSADGSILIVAVWHGCFNFMSASDAGNGILAAVVSTLVMIWAVIVVVVFKPRNLAHGERQVV